MTGTAVVTGAAQGIGRAIAERLTAEGWRVWRVDVIAHDDVDEVCDVSEPAAVAHLWNRIDDAGQHVTALINNAGIFLRDPALTMAAEDWNQVLAVNLSGSFFMAQQAAQRFAAHSIAGSIVSIASGQAYRPGSIGAAYAASKAGLVNLTRALATEWGPLGIRVNTVVPGLTDTAQPRAVRNDADFAAAAAATPLRRLGTPNDIAAMVSFLLSADASQITGQAFAVNGGRVMI